VAGIESKELIKEYLLNNNGIILKTNVIKADHDGTAIENARKWAEQNKQIIFREDIGNVIFNVSGVKDSLSHGFGQKKLDAIPALPVVIKTGKIVCISSDFDGKPKKYIIIMAPIIYENRKNILAVRLVKNVGDNNRFYVHEVIGMPDKNKKGNTIRPSALDLTAHPQGGTALYLNILQDIWNVQ